MKSKTKQRTNKNFSKLKELLLKKSPKDFKQLPNDIFDLIMVIRNAEKSRIRMKKFRRKLHKIEIPAVKHDHNHNPKNVKTTLYEFLKIKITSIITFIK